MYVYMNYYGIRAFIITVVTILFMIVCRTVSSVSSWNKCANTRPILVLWNIPVRQCLLDCQFRSRCTAFNFWRRQKKCELLHIGSTFADYFSSKSSPCAHLKMSDVGKTLLQNQFSSICQAMGCTYTQTCDVSTCSIKECSALVVNNGRVVGNRLAIGSRVKVECEHWYYAPFNYSTMCQNNGSWSLALGCEPLYECSVPPPSIPNAKVEKSLVPNAVLYTCNYSYATENRERHLQLTCLETGIWNTSYTTFNCLLWGCPSGWHRINDSCYLADAGIELDFPHTQARCAGYNSYVLQLETQEENEVVKTYLYETFGHHSWWLGLTDKSSEGDWRWMAENTTADWLTWQPWEPQNRACEYHVVLYANNAWFDDCKQGPYTPVCEKGIEIIDSGGRR